MTLRTTCIECGDDLWSPAEWCGLCVLCQQAAGDEDDELPRDDEDEGDEPQGYDNNDGTEG